MLERVAIQFQHQLWLGISVAIGDAGDVYVNYLGDGQEMHTSHHASGQHHQKIGKRYVTWTGGPTRHWEPMKSAKIKPTQVSERESVAVWGWVIARIPSVLPPVTDACGMVVNAALFRDSWTLGLEVSIVSRDSNQRTEILGYPVVQRHRVSNGLIIVEIEAFVIDEEITTMECRSNSTGFTPRFLDIKDKRYILFRQEQSIYSPEGTTFGVFLRPAQAFTHPLASRVQSLTETDDEMWRWAENEARAHAAN
jgi:hypothetical protein